MVEAVGAEDVTEDDVFTISLVSTSLSPPEDVAEDVGVEDVGVEDVGVEDVGVEDVGVEDVGLEEVGLEDVLFLEDVSFEEVALEEVSLEDTALELSCSEEIKSPIPTSFSSEDVSSSCELSGTTSSTEDNSCVDETPPCVA